MSCCSRRALALFAAEVHLYAALQRGFGCRALFIQALGDAQPVNGMHPVETRGDSGRAGPEGDHDDSRVVFDLANKRMAFL